MQHHVLIVEDDQEQCQLLCRMLGRRHIQTSCAESLEEGLACARRQDYSCIVVDLGLPDSEHMETAERLNEFGDVPIVVITGNDDRDLIRVVRQQGAQYCLKGNDTPMIMEKVLMAIERRTPDHDIEEHIIDEQREIGRASMLKKAPWFAQWIPLLGFMLAFTGATMTGGAFLYRSISEQAVKSQQNEMHFIALDKSTVQLQNSMERVAVVQTELQMKAQTSSDDRAAIHREVGALMNQQRELKEDVVRRLERIEDGQQKLLTEMSKRP